MIIAFFPQYANRSYSSGKWHLLKDGHVRMMKNQIIAIESCTDKHEYIFIVPTLEDVEDASTNFLYDLDNKLQKKIDVKLMKLSRNVALNRFHFDMNELIKNKNCFSCIDLLITDVPELARNFKIFYKIHLKRDINIISNVHYLDIYPENSLNGESNYFWRQLDGLLCSNKNSFLVSKQYADFFRYAKEKISMEIMSEIMSKTSVLDFMIFSEDELNARKKEYENEKKLITFISRCSDDKRTRWKFFINTIKKLRNRREDFEVILTNPSGVKEKELDKEIDDAKDFITYSKKLDRNSYIDLLWKSDIVPLLYNIDNNMAVGFYEAIYCNNVPVQLGVDYSDDDDLLNVLHFALNRTYRNHDDRRKLFIEKGSCEKNSQKFYEKFIKDFE